MLNVNGHHVAGTMTDAEHEHFQAMRTAMIYGGETKSLRALYARAAELFQSESLTMRGHEVGVSLVIRNARAAGNAEPDWDTKRQAAVSAMTVPPGAWSPAAAVAA